MLGANPGHVILIILAVVILGQLLLQGFEHKKRHEELTERLDRLEAKMDR